MKKSSTFLLWFAIALTTIATSAYGQVQGTVSDQSGQPLIGVNITIAQESNTGTITDVDGRYIISASIGDTLIYSYIGFEEIQKVVNGTGPLDVIMGESSEVLNEVVVVGYGTLAKKDLTGTVAKIGTKDFNKGSIATPEALLNGKVAGLQITSGGEPGAGSEIILRGQSSINASSRPLFVIDGVQLDANGVAGGRNPLNFINAADIESMTVLKDASAAAIYGSRGASGVIIITTKSGKKGKLRIGYNANVNTSIFAGSSGYLSPENFRAAISAKAPQEIEFLGDENTDWVDAVTQSPLSTEHNLSLKGGKDDFLYNLSVGYLRSKGILRTSSHEKKSIAGKISKDFFNETLNIKINSRTSFLNDVFAPNVYGSALAFDPTRPILDPDSQYGGYFQHDDPLANTNPVSTIDLTSNKGNSIRTLNSAIIEYQIPGIKGLSLTTQGSYDYSTGDSRFIQDPLLKNGTNFENGGFLSIAETTNKTKQIDIYASYSKDLNGINSTMVITAGHSYLETDREGFSEFGNNLTEEGGELIYTTDIEQDSFSVINKLASFFGRVNYTYDNKYLVTASIRRDGSSRFGPSNRWGTFPAVAVGWRILQEDWASGLSNTFDNLKLRISYGITGNERFGDYLYNIFYRYGSPDASYQFGNAFVPTLRGDGVDPDIKWEETRSTNLGLDFGILNNRFSGSIDIYRKYTDELLFEATTSGFTNLSDRIITNIGEMENKGIEIALNAVILDRDNWDWDMSFNVAFNANKITKLDNSNDTTFIAYERGGISGDIGQTIQILQQEQRFNSFRVYEHKLDANGNPLPDAVDHNGDGIPNDLDIYIDQNGDGIINELDLLINGDPSPKVILGFTNNLRWGNWDLAATLRSHIGNKVYNNVASAAGYYQRLTDRVTNNIHESAFENDFQERQLKSDVYISDGSFVRLDNITLSYSMFNAGFLRDLRIYTTVTNLMTITGYDGLDPEISNGIDNNQYPRPRNFLLGISANF